jgi:phosphopentomutase
MKRVFLIVLDSVGCGYLPDAEKFDDVGADTLGHIAEKIKNFNLPNLFKLGLGNIVNSKNVKPVKEAIGIYGKMSEKSASKDTTIGHWEIAGIITEKPFPTYPNGFPEDLLKKFMEVTGVKGYLGNKPASGTEIIKELGEEHIRTGYPIVYTSADSVFQIAAHEEVIPIEKLYEICRKTREILVGEHNIGRVIARPFIGKPGNFVRTERRRDFSVSPSGETLLDKVKKAGKDVVAIGKIEDIFAQQGITEAIHTGNNKDGIQAIYECIKNEKINGLVFANLVDFDMLYGHRRNIEGYYNALLEFDNAIPKFLENLKNDDILFITADHGNDPTFKGTDHTREYVPILGYGPAIKSNFNIGVRETFADLGQTIAEILNVEKIKDGTSFWNLIKK